jgi:hypothetical protein
MKKLLSLIFGIAVCYGGLYFSYGKAVTDAVEEGLASRGLTAVEVVGTDYGWLAPLSTRSSASVVVEYGGAEAVVDVSVDGHPVFSSDVEIGISGLQRLEIRLGG